MATTVTDMTPRLVGLCSKAGLLGHADVERYVRRHEKHAGIIETLNRDVSLEAFRDLLFADIRLPFTSRKKKASPLGGQLRTVTDLRSEELIQMLQAHRPSLDKIVESLSKASVADEKQLEDALKEADRLGEEPYGWLVQQGLLSPAILNQFLIAPANPLVPRCALFMALTVLRHNKMIDQTTFDDLVENLREDSPKSSSKKTLEALRVDSGGLLEKIEGGLYVEDVSLPDTQVDPRLLALFPSGLVRRNLFVPIYRDDRRIGVAITDPLNVNLAVLIRWLTDKWMHPYFAPAGMLIDRINESYPSVSEDAESAPLEVARPSVAAPRTPPAGPDGSARIARAHDRAKTPKSAAARTTLSRRTTVTPTTTVADKGRATAAPVSPPRAAETPVDSSSAVQLVSSMIENAIELRATDIHMEPNKTGMIVRYRIDGLLQKILNIPPNMISAATSRVKVLSNMDVTERRRPQDGSITLDMDDHHYDFRVATLPTVYGEKVAIRILDSARVMTGLADVGMSDGQLDVMRRMIHRPYGIILVTGPTGSGKTSTLYATLSELNSEERHLVTIEDPVEYQLDGINQVQVDPNIGLTFSSGLRAILRQDPEIIMVGEIRDTDTTMTAIRAALTGHLVFSTLHTNTAIGAIQALSNLGASAYMIGSAITGVIAQRLVRKLCGACKKKRVVTKALAEQLGMPYKRGMRMYRPEGCPECLGTGYAGRVGIFEVLEMTESLRQAVLNGRSPEELVDVAASDGRQTIQASGLEKINAGVTSAEEVIEKVILEA